MDYIKICGKKKLFGSVKVQGSKNAALPVISAAVLTGGRSVLKNCPDLSDTRAAVQILTYLGAKCEFENGRLVIDTKNLENKVIDSALMGKLRSSITFTGALAGRFGYAKLAMPGGCELGPRPIDMHIEAFKKLGIDVQCQNGYIELKGKPRGGEIVLPFPSVGATQNAVLAAVLAKEETTIINCAKEPEIVCMQRFLKSAGANVEGAGSAVIKVYPCGGLCNAEHIVDGDRIAAATYMACFLSSGGEGSVCGADKTHLNAVLAVFEQMGANILCGENKIDISCREGLKPVMLQTQPYPGFPTDCLPIITALAATCDKTSVFSENIFKNRFHHAQELAKFGADVHIFGKTCVIKGTKKLCGAEVDACDLRGGASAVIAALAAEGTTIIKNPCYIDRGYEDICKHLKSLGADIKRVTLSSEE